MNAHDEFDESTPDPDERLLNELLPLLDRHWETLRRSDRDRAAAASPDEKPPTGPASPAEFRALEALHDAVAAAAEAPKAGSEKQAVDQRDTYDHGLPTTETFHPGVEIVPFQAEVGQKIGKYVIKEILQPGGQAFTFKAWDPDTERTVVLKIYRVQAREGGPDPIVEEAQRLTKVRSPYVVQCYHVERMDGYCCLVLEYVAGKSLAELHRATPLTVSESLRLIAKVAEGVAAMHARSLLHLDIKPGNIIVGDNGEPKLLDFGLAKPLGDPRLEDIAGTFPYMSPEQARGDADRIDQRTDVFGLGAALYFLLTGRAPYEGTPEEQWQAACAGNIVPPRQKNPKVPADIDRLCMRCLAKAPEKRFASALELINAIKRRDQLRFANLGLLAAAALLVVAIVAIRLAPHSVGNPNVASGGAVTAAAQEPAALLPLVIEKFEFDQYIKNESGERPLVATYPNDPFLLRFDDGLCFRAQLSRPAYCYWIAFLPTGEIELCFPDNENEPPPRTDLPAYDPADALFVLNDQVGGVQGFVLVVSDNPLPAFSDWKTARPDCPWPPPASAERLVYHHDGKREISRPFDPSGTTRGKDEPRSGPQQILGNLVAWARGDDKATHIISAWAFPVLDRDAQPQSKATFDVSQAQIAAPIDFVSEQPVPGPRKPPHQRLLKGGDATKAATLEKNMAEAVQADRYEDAVTLSEELIALRTTTQGADHWQTTNAIQSQEALRTVASWSPEQRAEWRRVRGVNAKAQELFANSQYRAAQDLFDEYHRWCVHSLGAESLGASLSYNNLAANLSAQSKYVDAQPLLEKALHIRRKLLGELHPSTALSYSNFAQNLKSQGKYLEAQRLFQQSLDLCRELHGDDHPETAERYHTLAQSFYAAGRHQDAQPFFQKAFGLFQQHFGEMNADTAMSLNSLAANCAALGKYADAQQLYHKALEVCRVLRGEHHEDTIAIYSNLAGNLVSQGKFDEAEPIYEKSLDFYRDLFGEMHVKTAMAYDNLANNMSNQGRHAVAWSRHQQALEIRRGIFGEDHPDIARSYSSLARNLREQQQYADAEHYYQKALDLNRKLLGEVHPETASAYNNLALSIDEQGKFSEAQPLFQKALDLRRLLLGEVHADTAMSFNNLSANLISQLKYSDAQQLLWQSTGCYEAARIRISSSGIDRATFGALRSPYRLLAVTQARLGRFQEAWMHAETDFFRGASDESVSHQKLGLNPSEVHRESELIGRLSAIDARNWQFVTKRELPEDQQAELSLLRGERQAVEESLLDLAVARSRRQVFGLNEVQSAIPRESALVFWVDASDRSGGVQEHWGCVLRDSGGPRWVRLVGTGPESSWTNDDTSYPSKLRGVLASRDVSVASAMNLADRLYFQRLGPLSPHLEGVDHLYVVFASEMAGIPIEVLTDKYTISYVPSGTFLARLKDQNLPLGKRMLTLADPVFQAGKVDSSPSNGVPAGGVLITQVAADSVAAKAGLKPRDVLLRYGDIELTSVESLTEAVKAQAPASEVALIVWREGLEEPFTCAVPAGRLGVVSSREPAQQAVANLRKTDEMLLALRGGDWKNLPFTRAEAAQIANLFGSESTNFIASEASEQSLDRLRTHGELSKYRYLHFATHGEANNVRAMESALILAQDALPKDFLPQAGKPFINGQLSAREVLDFWKLDAELVTLSACETALGRPGGGDGLLGFAQAFLVAGSRAVCLSLWKVDDRATAILMTRFYQNLLGKRPGLTGAMPKAAALDEAKRWLRELSWQEAEALTKSLDNGAVRESRGKDGAQKSPESTSPPQTTRAGKPFAHPHYWAAFILIGDPN